jgi:hypothetical protein
MGDVSAKEFAAIMQYLQCQWSPEMTQKKIQTTAIPRAGNPHFIVTAHDDPDFALTVEKEKGHHQTSLTLQVRLSKESQQQQLTVGATRFTIADFDIEVRAKIMNVAKPPSWKKTWESDVVNAHVGPVWELTEQCLKGHGPFDIHPCRLTVTFWSRVSSLHRRSVALVSMYASVKGIPFDVAKVEDAWLFYRKRRETEYADTLQLFLCRCFSMVVIYEPNVFPRMSCAKLSDIISSDLLQTHQDEASVMQVVIDWARLRLRDGKYPQRPVEGKVRVKASHVDASWRNADCVIKHVAQEPSRLLIQRKRKATGAPDHHTSVAEGDSQQLLHDEEVVAHAADVYSTAETGMIRLLEHVRHVYISTLGMQKLLCAEGAKFAQGFECVREMIAERTRKTTRKTASGMLTDVHRYLHACMHAHGCYRTAYMRAWKHACINTVILLCMQAYTHAILSQ